MTETADSHEILDALAAVVSEILRNPDQDARSVAVRFYHRTSSAIRAGFDGFLLRMDDPLAWEAGTPESRFVRRACRMAYIEACRRHGAPPDRNSGW